MNIGVRWLKRFTILGIAIGTTGLVLTLLVHTVMAKPRARKADRPAVRREFRPGQPVKASPEVLKQLAIVTLIGLVGRTVLRIRLT
jgi:hypothetical protein